MLVCVPPLVVFVVDPYQVFHRSWLPRVFFYKDNERYQVAGLLKQYLAHDNSFDSVIVGSSVSANIAASDMQSTLDWRALNVSMRAASLQERYFVLQQALASPKIRRVLLEVYASDIQTDTGFVTEQSGFPVYLYSDSWFDKRRYVFNFSVFYHALVLSKLNGYLDFLPVSVSAWIQPAADGWHEGDVDDWNVWITDPGHAEEFERFNQPENLARKREALARAREEQHRTAWEWRRDYPFTMQKTCIVDIVRAHPDVQFVIWFAPVSLARYASENAMDTINQQVELRRFLVKSLAALSHVQIYGFDNVLDFTANLHNYMDYSHYTQERQRWVLREMAQGHYRMDEDTVDAYVEQLRRNILLFDIPTPVLR